MATAPDHLDVRSLSQAERDARILSAFESLGTDGRVVVIDNRDARRLLERLEAHHPGSVEWTSLEAGPDRYRVEIRRRSPDAVRTVSDYLGYDHRRLDGMLPAVGTLVAAGDLEHAREQFAEFSCGLSRHIDAEEQVLFPDMERRTERSAGPTMVMRAEHVEIRNWMECAAAALKAEDADGFRSALQGMQGVLEQHNVKEEYILYPMADEAAREPGGLERLIRRMQALL